MIRNLSAKVAARGPKETITSLKVSSEGQIVVVKLKDGKEFYLTPEKAEDFKLLVEGRLHTL